VVVTPTALEYYQETFRQLAFEYAECWLLCCKAEDACRAERLARIRRKMMVQNGGAAVTWSEVLIVAADDAKYWDKEVRRPAMLYLARGKRGGEPTAAYEEDQGITAKVKAQLTHGGKHASEPPIADEGSPKRVRKSKAEKRAAREVGSPGGSGGGGRGHAQNPPRNLRHPAAAVAAVTRSPGAAGA
jgi:hypothetical protein